VREHPIWSVGVNSHKRIGGVLLGILTGQLFAAKGWCVKATTREAKQVIVDLEPTRASAICSGCGETKKRIHDAKPARTWRHTDLWNMPTLVRTAPRRVRCRHCGVRIEQARIHSAAAACASSSRRRHHGAQIKAALTVRQAGAIAGRLEYGIRAGRWPDRTRGWSSPSPRVSSPRWRRRRAASGRGWYG
jgi:transposase